MFHVKLTSVVVLAVKETHVPRNTKARWRQGQQVGSQQVAVIIFAAMCIERRLELGY